MSPSDLTHDSAVGMVLGRSESASPRLRILAVSDIWQGSNAYAFVRAFRRMGHSVTNVPPSNYVPGDWKSTPLRALRRALEPVLVGELSRALVHEANHLRPDLFFVFKGRYVHPDAIRAIKGLGATAINFYPDVSFLAHGKYIPAALPVYDWVFTTKGFGIEDMCRLLGVTNASLLPHGFDPEVHMPIALNAEDRERYECDASFIGTWSPKKQSILERVCAALPGRRIRIWGEQWGNASTLEPWVQGRHVLGLEYAKALRASKVNIAILSEARRGSSDGDQITSRTFHIPATGSFMVHERTDELLGYFSEGAECACFDGPDELVDKIEYYLHNEAERVSIADAGRRRAIEAGYSVEDRAAQVLAKVDELRRGASRA